MNPPMNWLPVIVCPFLVLFWFCFVVSRFGFVSCAFAVCLVDDDDGLLDYVQVLQFSCVTLNSRWP